MDDEKKVPRLPDTCEGNQSSDENHEILSKHWVKNPRQSSFLPLLSMCEKLENSRMFLSAVVKVFWSGFTHHIRHQTGGEKKPTQASSGNDYGLFVKNETETIDGCFSIQCHFYTSVKLKNTWTRSQRGLWKVLAQHRWNQRRLGRLWEIFPPRLCCSCGFTMKRALWIVNRCWTVVSLCTRKVASEEFHLIVSVVKKLLRQRHFSSTLISLLAQETIKSPI